jgi:hypothetical protein
LHAQIKKKSKESGGIGEKKIYERLGLGNEWPQSIKFYVIFYVGVGSALISRISFTAI